MSDPTRGGSIGRALQGTQDRSPRHTRPTDSDYALKVAEAEARNAYEVGDTARFRRASSDDIREKIKYLKVMLQEDSIQTNKRLRTFYNDPEAQLGGELASIAALLGYPSSKEVAMVPWTRGFERSQGRPGVRRP